MRAAGRLADFVVGTTLAESPPAALRLVRHATLEALGAMLAGAALPVARIARELVRAEGGPALCTIVGTALRTSPTWAALANGVAGAAGEREHAAVTIVRRSPVPLVAAGLACAEADPADGGTFLVGCIVGLELAAALAGAGEPRPPHRSPPDITVGAAAAAARIAALDAEQTRRALRLAASLAVEVESQADPMTRAYDAGRAARNAVVAARLAREGFAVEAPPPAATWSGSPESIDTAWATPSAWRAGAPERDDRGRDDAVQAAFLERAAPIIGRAEAEDLAEQIAHLEDVPDVRVLTAQLAGPLT